MKPYEDLEWLDDVTDAKKHASTMSNSLLALKNYAEDAMSLLDAYKQTLTLTDQVKAAKERAELHTTLHWRLKTIYLFITAIESKLEEAEKQNIIWETSGDSHES